MQPPESLIDAVARHGLAPRSASWQALAGGRTNRVWRIGPVEDSLICKLFVPVGGNLLYPNLPGAEYEALKALSRHRIAPQPLALLNSRAGDALIYRHLPGESWRDDVAPVARLLSRLHQLPLRLPLRRLPAGPGALRRSIAEILSACDSVPERLTRIPALPELPAPAAPVLLHTDVVPGNIIVTDNGLRLIDWQCPALGDPCEDLASFLSPAMQYLYTGRILAPGQAEAFLSAYGDPVIAARYRLLAPLYHLRIAAYCHWKQERGAEDYGRAMVLELEALETGLN